MHLNSGRVGTDKHDDATKELKYSSRSYIVMPNFVSSSATSFEKFSKEVEHIVTCISGLSDMLSVSVMHPEHVQRNKRCPHPVFILQWFQKA